MSDDLTSEFDAHGALDQTSTCPLADYGETALDPGRGHRETVRRNAEALRFMRRIETVSELLGAFIFFFCAVLASLVVSAITGR